MHRRFLTKFACARRLLASLNTPTYNIGLRDFPNFSYFCQHNNYIVNIINEMTLFHLPFMDYEVPSRLRKGSTPSHESHPQQSFIINSYKK